MHILLGYGTTNKALAEKLCPCVIFDDSFLDSSFDSFGNLLKPAKELKEFLEKNENLTIITSPGIPPQNKMIIESQNAVESKKAKLLSEYDFFAASMPPSVWISGTNGKTTTTQILAYLLKDFGALSGGNIGTPLASLDTNAKLWILETSSFTLHYTNIAKPMLYLLLPLSEDHITWHGDFSEYVNAKLKPILSLREKEIAILPESLKEHKFCKESLANLIFYKNTQDLARIFNLNLDSINFKEPFLLDATLALSACEILFSTQNYELLNSFKIGAHKIEEFRDSKNRLWVDDSKGTNLDATICAINSYKDKEILLILGGDDKGADLTPLFEAIKKQNIKIYAIGSNTQKLHTLAQAQNTPCKPCYNLKVAVDAIKNDFKDSTQIALLSPAAASLDQFKSYKDRGEQFKKFALES
ncbi:MAG: UDP-N-acetylmuramoyl-L-alanine--D-glutamate ligase [Helicobacter sp.]|nr:UDP-N-acetylmuramoyl-L-alanine--D-glutamate ligase [Helicobacteraceae bacterium]MDY3112925.1 UDP-N-acetylmuramoyl-L-alanine--D-glutamate ligase [Helicobacter sp.]